MSSNYVCIACGHEGTDEFEMRRMWTGFIAPVCYGCIDKYEEACREGINPEPDDEVHVRNDE